MLDEHFAASAVRLVAQRRTCPVQSAAQLGEERHPALQHDTLGHGAVAGGGGGRPRGRSSKRTSRRRSFPLCAPGRWWSWTTSRLTRAKGWGSSSRSEDASSYTCRPTRLTSTP